MLALVCSHAAALYAAARFTIHYQLQGNVKLTYAAMAVVAMAVGTALARRQIVDLPAGRKWLLGSAGILLWVSVIFVLLEVAVHSQIPGPVLGLLWASGFFWTVWTIWAGSFFRSVGIIAGTVLVGLIAVPFWTLMEATGMRGSSRVEISWRRPLKPAVPAEDSTTVSLPGDVLWTGYLGVTRDGVVPGVTLSEDWVGDPPTQEWRHPCGRGWSSFAVTRTTLFGQEQLSTGDCVTARDLATGELMWTTPEGTAGFTSGAGGDGPRATPTLHRIDGDGPARLLLFAAGPTGVLSCLEASSGNVVWRTDLMERFPGLPLVHGVCGSPLIVDDVVVVAPPSHKGPCLVAFSLLDGTLVWTCESDWRASYASPVLMTICERRQIVLHAGPGVLAVDPSDGRVHWQFEWTNEWDNNATQPLQAEGHPNDLFIATGYKGGVVRISISPNKNSGLQATEVWRSQRTMKTKFSNMAQFGDVLVGLDNGILCGVDVQTGRRYWKNGRYNFGQLLKIGEHLLIVEEDGRICLVKPDVTGHRPVGNGFQALDRKTWGHPVFVDDRLILRNDRQIVCLRLPVDPASSVEGHKSHTPYPTAAEPLNATD